VATLGTLQSDSIAIVDQVLVRNPIPVPIGDSEVKSLVIPDLENTAQSAQDRITSANTTQDGEAFQLSEERTSPSETLFLHRENTTDESYKSFTQTWLSDGGPGTLQDDPEPRTVWSSTELTHTQSETAFYPGREAKEKAYRNHSNPPLDQPSTKNNQDNRGKPLTTESWTFNRVE
jgi:hypothetical protein